MSAADEIDAMATRLDLLSATLSQEQQSDARELAASLRQLSRQLRPEAKR